MRYTKLNQNQSGLVSIIVTMFIMMILGITVIGFAQVSRREQRQTLDRQLSTAAYYSAESGINDIMQKLDNGSLADITDCNDGALPASERNIGSSGNFSYTCALLTQAPGNLEYGSIDTDKSQMVPINTTANINRIEISWQDKSGGAIFSTSTPPAVSLPSKAAWTFSPGMLEVYLTPESSYTRTNMTANTIVGYLYPSNRPAGTLLPTSRGDIVSGGCNNTNTPKHCKVSITVPLGNKFRLRLRSIYKSNAVTVTAYNGVTPVSVTGTQSIIDVTGRASDVLRRVQVRVPRYKNYNYPEYVLDSADTICKRLQVYPTGGTVDGKSDPVDPTLDPACKLY